MSRKFGIEIEAGDEVIQLPVGGDGRDLVDRLRKHANENEYIEVNICINLGNDQPIDSTEGFLLNSSNDLQWLFAYDFAAYWMQRMTAKGRRYFRKHIYDWDGGVEELRNIAIEASDITE